ncbi:PqqD family peptide modification chaperone [Clostridium gasigenes]|uniref:B12-binding domain-containing radical SAM protein n=1 Tax=Clostridium gasigenes TaxID=94869 RepID=UPI001C0E78BD|nr:PqqD family peptide modification chaperone [Clostridium gasigenes]
MWNYKPCKITQCYKDKDDGIEVLSSDGYLKLRGAGRIVWIMSDGENTISEIVDEILKINESSDRNGAYSKVTNLIRGLADKMLIIPDWDPLYKKSNIMRSEDVQELDVLLILAPSPQPGLTIGNKVQGMPPLGLGYIGTYLMRNNYKCKILDFNVENVSIETLEDILRNQHPKLVGISTTTETYKTGIRIADKIKQINSESIIFMGGYHVTFEFEDALNTGVLDFIIRGEGEITTKLACDYYINNIGSLEDINGISYVKDGKIISNKDAELIKNLDELYFPDRELFDLSGYAHKANCSTSRGCPGKCIFCAASGLSGGKYRMRSVENVIVEFKYLKNLGCNHVDIVDDTMTADVKRLKKFISLLKEEKLNMTWYCESRVDIMTKELLMDMKSAGLKFIQFGVEAGSQKMLDCLKKNITIEQIQNVFIWCRELDIETSTCLIIGQPYDTKETIRDTIDMAANIRSLGANIIFTVSTPFPGTYMWNNMEELKMEVINSDLNHYSTFEPVYNTPHLTSTEIRNSFFDAYSTVRKIKVIDGKDVPDKAMLIRRNML